MKLFLITILGLLSAANAFCMFGQLSWYSPFIGLLCAFTIPYWAAMIMQFGVKNNANYE